MRSRRRRHRALPSGRDGATFPEATLEALPGSRGPFPSCHLPFARTPYCLSSLTARLNEPLPWTHRKRVDFLDPDETGECMVGQSQLVDKLRELARNLWWVWQPNVIA